MTEQTDSTAPPEPTQATGGTEGDNKAPAPQAAPPSDDKDKAGAPATQAPVPPSVPEWANRRIDELTAARRAAEREAAELKAQVAALRAAVAPAQTQGQTPAPGQTPPQPPAQPDQAQIQQMAAQLAAEQRFTEQCNELYSKGMDELKDGFKGALDIIQRLGGLSRPMVEATLELNEGHKLLVELAKRPEEFQRIQALSPVRQATAMAKLASGLGAMAKVSSAPPPVDNQVRTGRGTATTALDDDKTPIEVWMRERQKQLKERRA